MAFKFLVLCALVAVANCGIIGAPYAAYPSHTTFTYPAAAPTIVKTVAAAPTIVKQVTVEPAPAPVEYEFMYEVNHPETGDIKMQKESRKGDDVTGSYSLVEPDGLNRRIVEYTASEAGGFNAVVRKEPLSAPAPTTPAPAPVITKVIAPAPAVVHKYIAPAPVVHKYIQPAPILAPAPAVHKVIAAPATGASFSSFQLSSPVVKYGW